MPVAAKNTSSLRTRSRSVRTRSMSRPAAITATRSPGFCGASWPSIAPPSARTAQAAMTTSGVPPMPIRTSTPEPGVGQKPRAFSRTHGHVHPGPHAVADDLAVEQHRGLVFLTLADDDDALDLDGREHQAHRRNGGLVAGLLSPATHPPARGERGSFGHAGEFKGQVAPRTVAHGRRTAHMRSYTEAASGVSPIDALDDA